MLEKKRQQIPVMPMPWDISVHYSRADAADHRAWTLQERVVRQRSCSQRPSCHA
jgi:hypothetical protein